MTGRVRWKYLAHDEQFVPPTVNRLPNDPLGFSTSVHLGSIDMSGSGFDTGLDCRDDLLLIIVFYVPGPQSDYRKVYPCSSESSQSSFPQLPLRQPFAIGIWRPLPNAFVDTLSVGAACRLLNSFPSTILTTRSTIARSNPRDTISSISSHSSM